MAETFLARQDLDKSAEIHDARDPAFINSANFHIAHNVLDDRLRLLCALAIRSRNEDRAVLLDVDLCPRLFDDLLDRLAARADDLADLVHMDLHDRDARRIGREVVCRLVNDSEHLVQDKGAAALRL